MACLVGLPLLTKDAITRIFYHCVYYSNKRGPILRNQSARENLPGNFTIQGIVFLKFGEKYNPKQIDFVS